MLPVLRSQHLADLLTVVLLHPEQEYTQTELASLVKTPLTTVQREVQRLADAGLISERRVGRSRLLQVNQRSRYLRPLTELMTIAFGPHVVVGEEFADIANTDAVAIYGSWAARYHGAPGTAPNDLDILAIGRPDRCDIYAAAERAEQRLSLPVNPTVCSPQRWQEANDAFIQQVKSTPLVWVPGADKYDKVA